MLQLTCMHDLGITALPNLSLQDKELLTDTLQWKALLKAEIQSNKNQVDALAKKQTWQCEKQAKRKEAREYLRDKKGPCKKNWVVGKKNNGWSAWATMLRMLRVL
jgi:hypothetical protein